MIHICLRMKYFYHCTISLIPNESGMEQWHAEEGKRILYSCCYQSEKVPAGYGLTQWYQPLYSAFFMLYCNCQRITGSGVLRRLQSINDRLSCQDWGDRFSIVQPDTAYKAVHRS